MERTTRPELEALTANLAQKMGRTLILDHRSVPGNPYTWTVFLPTEGGGQEYAFGSRYFKASELASALRVAWHAIDLTN